MEHPQLLASFPLYPPWLSLRGGLNIPLLLLPANVAQALPGEGRNNPGGEGGILLLDLPHPLKSLVHQGVHLNTTL